MNINKEELKQKFIDGDINFLINKVYEISIVIVSNTKFGINMTNSSLSKRDLIQECAIHFYKNYVEKKIDPNKNIFSFIWTSSRNKMIEILRKQSGRNKIRYFESYDYLLENSHFDASYEEKSYSPFISFTFDSSNRVFNIPRHEFQNKKSIKQKLINLKRQYDQSIEGSINTRV